MRGLYPEVFEVPP